MTSLREFYSKMSLESPWRDMTYTNVAVSYESATRSHYIWRSTRNHDTKILILSFIVNAWNKCSLKSLQTSTHFLIQRLHDVDGTPFKSSQTVVHLIFHLTFKVIPLSNSIFIITATLPLFNTNVWQNRVWWIVQNRQCMIKTYNVQKVEFKGIYLEDLGNYSSFYCSHIPQCNIAMFSLFFSRFPLSEKGLKSVSKNKIKKPTLHSPTLETLELFV